jgi:hypothetical protein
MRSFTPYSLHDAKSDQTIVLNGCDYVHVFLKAAAMMLLEIFPYPDQIPAGRMPHCHELADYLRHPRAIRIRHSDHLLWSPARALLPARWDRNAAMRYLRSANQR